MFIRLALVAPLPCRKMIHGRRSASVAVRISQSGCWGVDAFGMVTISKGALGLRPPSGRSAANSSAVSFAASQSAPAPYAARIERPSTMSARRRRFMPGKMVPSPPLLEDRMKIINISCAVVAMTAVAMAGRPLADGEPTKLLRMPTVSATQIAFAYANNIWTVDRTGGMARRLTSFQGQTINPHFSPDGKWIAFSGEYAGNVDVYVVSAEGGEPKRLTWHPGPDTVEGWTPDGAAIVFASTRATAAPSGAPRFWTVPAQGGVEEPMPLPRAYQGKISADGTHVAYRMNNSWDEERRNYRGGQNRPVWIVDLKTFDLVSPPWTDSKDIEPVWVGDSVYFLSDRDGVSNVWSFETKGKKLAQVTKFPYFDVKSMDAN